MSPSDPRYLLKQAFIFPIGVAYVILNFMMLVTDAGRKYARYWLAVLFALPLAVLSSSSACFVWLLAYLVNHGWVPWSAWICAFVNQAAVHVFLFGHGNMLKLLLLAMTLYAFGPVPSPAMHYLVEDMDGTSNWLIEELWDTGPDIGEVGRDWTKFAFWIMAYRQLTNVLAETDAWEAIVTGSVLKPRLMRVVIHFQVIYTLACVSWLRHEFAEANARVEDKEGEEELRRRFMHEYANFRERQQEEDEQKGGAERAEKRQGNKKRRKARRSDGDSA